jgi:hypothetical protein
MSFKPDAPEESPEERQIASIRALRAALAADLYTGSRPNENMTRAVAALERCERQNISLASEPGDNPEYDAYLERDASEQEMRQERKRKAERRTAIRNKVALGLLPPLPPPSPKDFGANKILARVLQNRRDDEYFDSFYGVV